MAKKSKTLEWPQNDQEQQGFTEDDGFVATLLKKVDENGDVESDDEESEVENLVKQKVDVIKVVSPELIYIKFLHLEEQERKLHKELQICYHKERELKASWEEKEDCVIPYNDYYVRGKILEKVEDKYKVNVYDKATELLLPKEEIYVYSNYFRKYPNIVYKSHLARIKPAGGDKWSLSSIEALERMFDKYKDIYATKSTR
ncbi:hypothetical protein NQ314_004151 [Rhamnusium bicolor]|uniref:Tudor domain-containing protein n=1 Tax=Rhamnusium bicolor TaxID=1586634 RepID=A0AAV8ZMU8_9CUCU|nr:hypothetical protein NQ314_004151 [Rhamnusium bicolor]